MTLQRGDAVTLLRWDIVTLRLLLLLFTIMIISNDDDDDDDDDDDNIFLFLVTRIGNNN